MRIERKTCLPAAHGPHTGGSVYPGLLLTHLSAADRRNTAPPTLSLCVPLPFLQGEIAVCILNYLHQSPLLPNARENTGPEGWKFWRIQVPCWLVGNAYFWFLGNKPWLTNKRLLLVSAILCTHIPQGPVSGANTMANAEPAEIQHPCLRARLQTFGSKSNGDTMGSSEAVREIAVNNSPCASGTSSVPAPSAPCVPFTLTCALAPSSRSHDQSHFTVMKTEA